MSDNKKYYYLRLKEDFFTSETITLLESMKDGVLYSNILLKLYLMSLKNNGIKAIGKAKKSNRFLFLQEGEFMNTTQTENTDNKKTIVIQKEIGNTRYTVNIFCKKNGKELKDKMKSIIKQEVIKNNDN